MLRPSPQRSRFSKWRLGKHLPPDKLPTPLAEAREMSPRAREEPQPVPSWSPLPWVSAQFLGVMILPNREGDKWDTTLPTILTLQALNQASLKPSQAPQVQLHLLLSQP